jgi:hypothetical protein
MTEKLTLVEFDGLTGIETIRELTKDELAEHSELVRANEALLLEEQTKADAKASALAKLAALGLTEEEIAAL